MNFYESSELLFGLQTVLLIHSYMHTNPNSQQTKSNYSRGATHMYHDFSYVFGEPQAKF